MTLLYRFFFSLVFCAGIWLGGFIWFGLQVPTTPAKDPMGDAIIVLTGGAGRLEYGLELLVQNKGKVLFISGVAKEVRLGDIIRQASPETRRMIKRMKPQPVYLGARAQNTIGNAEESRDWLEGKQYQRLILVTSSYHMPRSLSEFRVTLPEMTLIPAPVFHPNAGSGNWLLDKESRNLLLSEYHKYLASKLRHWIVSATHES